MNLNLDLLRSERIRLEPLEARHLAALRELANDPALWEYTFQPNPFATDAETRRWFDEAMQLAASQPFAIVDARSDAVVGSTRYLDIVPEHRKLEIGWTFVARTHWRTFANTECKYLLLRYAFERWNALRVALKGEAINQRSRNAMARIGATYEGTLRRYRIRPDGEPRDVAFYSIIASEWPSVKSRLESMRAQTIP